MMNSGMELKTEYATVSNAVRFDGNDGIEEQKRALRALLSRCGSRGLQEAVKHEKRHIEAMERECSASAPEIYSASVSGVQGRGDQFRHGSFRDRAYMTVDDFAAYYSQCRQSTPTASGVQRSVRTVTAKDCMDSGAILCSTQGTKNKKKYRIKEKNVSVVTRVEKMAQEWFAPDDRMLSRRTRRKPLPMSMIACFVVLAVSLMLLVSGSVMVAGAKRDVSALKKEVSSLSDEAQLLENKWESQIDYLEIYRIATQEYGMIDANFVKGSQLGAGGESYIEVYDKSEQAPSGLSTLLAAIGIHLGE